MGSRTRTHKKLIDVRGVSTRNSPPQNPNPVLTIYSIYMVNCPVRLRHQRQCTKCSFYRFPFGHLLQHSSISHTSSHSRKGCKKTLMIFCEIAVSKDKTFLQIFISVSVLLFSIGSFIENLKIKLLFVCFLDLFKKKKPPHTHSLMA